MWKTWQRWTLAGVLPLVWAGVLPAQTTPAPSPADAPAASKPDGKPEAKPEARPAAGDRALADQQAQVGERFRELERLLLRMAELTAPTDPRRAALLRQAVAQAKKRDIDHQFDELVELLRQERLAAVTKSQGEVQQDLARLLELLLSEDRTKRIESEKERIRQYLKRVNKIIKEQKAVQGETARGGDPDKLAEQQGGLSDKTGELAKDLEQDAGKKPPAESAEKDEQQNPDKGDKPDGKKPEGKKPDGSDPEKTNDPKGDDKPGGDKSDDERQQGRNQKKDNQQDTPGGKPGGQPQDQQPQPSPGQPSDQSSPSESSQAQKRLEQAQKRMKEAEKKLEDAQRKEATEKQAEAIKELEQAKADLEEILRQLREEEMSRTLAMLEGRFRKMLDQQVEVYEGTKRVDKVPEAQRDRDDEIEAGRLSRKEAEIASQAEKALEVLREEGSAVAFPEAITEMRDDMEEVARRLSQTKVGEVTQGIEKDIIAALEEMIAALQKAQKDLESKDKQGQSVAGADDEPPLVDTLSELKMIRALQMRVNVRTQRYAAMTKTEQAEARELLESLKQLAEREQRIHKVTRDIVVGRNR